MLVIMVILGTMPLFASFYQFLLVGLHRYRDHYESISDVYPRTAVIVPAWNEGAVIGATVDRLVQMDYPPESLRVYVVDDASTDDTPEVLRQKMAEYPGRVYHIRREKGGQGKAHTLNHGIHQLLEKTNERLAPVPSPITESERLPDWRSLELVEQTAHVDPSTEEFTRPGMLALGQFAPSWVDLADIVTVADDDWVEALMIIDADVIFERDALRKMARHLSDASVGAVTAYIKEGSEPGNYLQKFIGYEYITAQAASRRAQNVMGAMFCLAGGAQLHSRQNLELIGGRIDTSSLAEDTFTTFKTQIEAEKKVYFEGNAIVWAEEPDSIIGLWKQRLRWARGNVQLTQRFKSLWFNPKKHKKLGSFSFGFLWFSIFLMPLFMISASVGLVALYFIDFPLSWKIFGQFWIFHAINYLFVTLMSFAIDPQTAKRTWVEGFLFPGLISFTIIVYSVLPRLFEVTLVEGLTAVGWKPASWLVMGVVLFMYAWQGACMLAAWGIKILENTRFKWLNPFLTYMVGFGPILCAVTFHSYIMEAKGAEMKWDKTEKTGKVRAGMR